MIFILFLFYACSGNICQKGSDKNNTGTESNEDKKTASSDNDDSPKVNFVKDFRQNCWFKGTIEDIPVWLYVNLLDDTYCSAYYGYNSSNGAANQLSGKFKNNMLSLEFEDYISG